MQASPSVDSTVTGVVTRLGSEALGAAEVVNLAKQDFKHAVCDTGSVARQLVACKTSSIECQATLGGPDTLDTGTSQGTAVVLGVVL